ncbi:MULTISPECIES: pitrilysin family protein [unclassified Paracoccus (in: a-proteobacteria)]|uniref:M16 family metallopeptidase n=1 Tax=unclassified Paracoccus (in: a-proteobacteria) TaxID=2688777 RepID=UPI001602941E|nr:MULTISPECIES: pitrilysin family protein [unclassified Paracoccus (in: a-proteobacteria)]MBB1492106.1 insulinase family protein [Paracoccus sp. MC1854]MBB1497992.1 insulinase family protein [Paracoccus sp. MC1862]QQO44375.1 insulinase family protein [Paracoccus sp. MC1862]
MRRTLAFLLATAATPALAEMPPGISHFTLDNGLEAVVIEDHRAPVVVQMLWYRIGSADEQRGKSGLAHYLEHLMFKGTEKLAPGELSRTVTANGGRDNAFTSYDFTTYFQRIASDRLDLVMGMEADRMANLRIGEDDWQAERQVVLEERAQRTDSDPRALFGEERAAVQYYNHPYGRPVIGWRQEMEALTREDALEWYDNHYAPNVAVLVVAGDVSADEVRALAEKHYGPIPPKPEAPRDARPQEPVQRAERRMTMSDPRVPQPVLSRSVIVPERNPGDQKTAAALSVLAELLAGSAQTSFLGQRLVLTGQALWVGAGYDGLSVDPTTFSVSMAYAPGGDDAAAEAALEAGIRDFLAEGPDPEQLERVKTQLRAAQIYKQDSAHARAYDYGQGLAVGLTVEDVNDWPEILAAVTAEDVQAVARLVFEDRAEVTSLLKPADPEQMAGAEIAAAATGAGAGAGESPADGAGMPAASSGMAAETAPGAGPLPGPTEAAAEAPAAASSLPEEAPYPDTAAPGTNTPAPMPADTPHPAQPAPASPQPAPTEEQTR